MFHTKVKSLNKIFLATFFSLHKPGQKRSFFQKGFQCEFVDGFPMVFPHFFRFVRVPVVVIVAVAVVVVVVAVDVAVVVYLVVLGGTRRLVVRVVVVVVVGCEGVPLKFEV